MQRHDLLPLPCSSQAPSTARRRKAGTVARLHPGRSAVTACHTLTLAAAPCENVSSLNLACSPIGDSSPTWIPALAIGPSLTHTSRDPSVSLTLVPHQPPCGVTPITTYTPVGPALRQSRRPDVHSRRNAPGRATGWEPLGCPIHRHSLSSHGEWHDVCTRSWEGLSMFHALHHGHGHEWCATAAMPSPPLLAAETGAQPVAAPHARRRPAKASPSAIRHPRVAPAMPAPGQLPWTLTTSSSARMSTRSLPPATHAPALPVVRPHVSSSPKTYM